MTPTVMIVAGGTGGHVYPGLAVAADLRARGVALHWVGTARGVEARVVPAAGVAFSVIPVHGLRRSGAARWLAAPWNVALAVGAAIRAILRVRPQVVLGMGGFVSGPGGVAAWLCRRPLVIHEQNAIPGLTNRLLARIATRVLEAFPGTFPATVGAVVTGNPVRAAISGIAAPAARFAARSGQRVLVFGGSRGAQALNELVPAALAASGMRGLRVRHQCGADAAPATRARYAAAGDRIEAEVEPYIEDMPAAYAWADLVIARAGAITIAEIAACGVAAILIPFPYAVDDHQTRNARVLVEHGAALALSERELDAATLGRQIARLLGDRALLLEMAERARALARPQASADVARHCLESIRA